MGVLINSEYNATLQEGIIQAKSDFYLLDNYISNISFKIDDTTSIVFTNYEMLKKYENILIENSTWYVLDPIYNYKPEYLSKILYDNVNLWYLLLFLNKMEDAYQFNRAKIRIIHPANISLLSEIYNNEKKYLKNIEIIDNSLQLKSLYDKSNSIIKFPNFVIGTPLNGTVPVNDSNYGNLGFSNIQYNLAHAYFNFPYSYTRPTGLTYGTNSVIGTILSKEDQIISIKPMGLGTVCKVYLNEQLMFDTKDNSEDLAILNAKLMATMKCESDTKYEINDGVGWYNELTNGLLVKIKSTDFATLNINKQVSIRFQFEGESIVFNRTINILDEIIFPVDLSNNYGPLLSLSISVIGDLTPSINGVKKYSDIRISYSPCNFLFANMRLSKNTPYAIRIESTNMNEFYPMINYSFKDYHIIGPKDLVERNIIDLSSLLPKTESPSNFIVNNSAVFKGLNLISLTDADELISTDLYANNLQDDTSTKLDDNNKNLLLFADYEGTNKKITDYYILSNIYCRNNLSEINGSMGFFFKGKTFEGKTYCYVYIMKMANEYTNSPKSLLHGLYKMKPDAKNIFLDSDELAFSNLMKIADTPQYISGNMENNTFVKILTNKNNIKIFDGKSQRPIIDFFDTDIINFNLQEQPVFGLALFNIRNPGYLNMTVMGKNNDEI